MHEGPLTCFNMAARELPSVNNYIQNKLSLHALQVPVLTLAVSLTYKASKNTDSSVFYTEIETITEFDQLLE